MKTIEFEDILKEIAEDDVVNNLTEEEIDGLLEDFIQMAEKDPTLVVERFDK